MELKLLPHPPTARHGYQALCSYTARESSRIELQIRLDLSIKAELLTQDLAYVNYISIKLGKINMILILLLKKKKKNWLLLAEELWPEKVKGNFRSFPSLGRLTLRWEQRTIFCSVGTDFLAPLLLVTGRECHSSALSSVLQCWAKHWALVSLNFCWNQNICLLKNLSLKLSVLGLCSQIIKYI